MCRMLALLSDNISNELILNAWSHFVAMSEDVTSNHELNHGTKGSFKHAHGWGMAWINKSDNSHNYHHSDIPPWESKISENIVNQLTNSKAVLFHSRQASPGLPISSDYVHPFSEQDEQLGSCSFCHNGTIFETQLLEYPGFSPKTNSDSEKMFYAILSDLKKKNQDDHVSSLQEKVNDLVHYTGANYLAFFGENFFASTNYRRNPKYFSLHYARSPEFLCVASEPTKELSLEWKTIPNHTVLFSENLNHEKFKIYS